MENSRNHNVDKEIKNKLSKNVAKIFLLRYNQNEKIKGESLENKKSHIF